MTDESIASAEARLLAVKLDDLEKRISENRRKGEKQHDENSARLASLDATITAHAADDKMQLSELNLHAIKQEVQMNLLTGQIAELLSLVKITRAVQTVSTFMRGAILFLTPFAAVLAGAYALYLYWRGKGPFPFP